MHGVLLDIDGTVTAAGEPIPGAARAIQELRDAGVPLLFATNTSRKSRREVADALREADIPVQDDEVLSAAYAAAAWLRTRGMKRVRLLLPRGAQEDYADFDSASDPPEAVVVGDLGDQVTFAQLNRAFRDLHAGARLVATQKNRAWKAADGWTLDAGAFVAGLEYAADVEALVIGKPATGFFEMAAAALGHPLENLIMVGDDLDSDVGGAQRAGLRGVLVRTGKFDADKLADSEIRPDAVLDSLADLPAWLASA